MRSATFALFIGIAYLSAGLLGLIPAALMPAPADAPPIRLNVLYGYVLGLFPVNVLHSAVHLAIGAWGIMAWRSDHLGRGMGSPKMYARALAIFYGALAVLGVSPDPKRRGEAVARLAEILGAVVLAGELSLMAAFTSNDLSRAHETLGRGEIPLRPPLPT